MRFVNFIRKGRSCDLYIIRKVSFIYAKSGFGIQIDIPPMWHIRRCNVIVFKFSTVFNSGVPWTIIDNSFYRNGVGNEIFRKRYRTTYTLTYNIFQNRPLHPRKWHLGRFTEWKLFSWIRCRNMGVAVGFTYTKLQTLNTCDDVSYGSRSEHSFEPGCHYEIITKTRDSRVNPLIGVRSWPCSTGDPSLCWPMFSHR